MGSSWSARKESRRCMRCFSPLELMGMTPGSTMTTTPTIRWCSSRTALVIRGTRSSASCSEPHSSDTTTSRLVHVNTALRGTRTQKQRYCWTISGQTCIRFLHGAIQCITVCYWSSLDFSCGYYCFPTKVPKCVCPVGMFCISGAFSPLSYTAVSPGH